MNEHDPSRRDFLKRSTASVLSSYRRSLLDPGLIEPLAQSVFEGVTSGNIAKWHGLYFHVDEPTGKVFFGSEHHVEAEVNFLKKKRSKQTQLTEEAESLSELERIYREINDRNERV